MTWFVLSYALLSLSEIAALPFLATMATQFSNENNRGSYMGIFGLGFSLTHILAPSIALALAGWMSFQGLWWVLMGMGFLMPILSFLVRPKREMAMN
jgi:predicted MFS family arabinose efflux permease